jgi:membrane-associated phospholipid phosphatase
MNVNNFAKIVSIILGPLWIPIILVILLFRTGLTYEQQITLVPILFIFQLLLPFIYMEMLIHNKKISDWDIRKREQRFLVLPIFTILTVIIMVLVYKYGTTRLFEMYVSLSMLLFLGTLTTLFWKISLHLMLNTAAIILINSLFDWTLLYLFLLIPVIGWSRYYLKHHTLLQIIMGTLLAIGVFATVLSF